MSRIFRAFLLVLVVAACGSPGGKAPRNLDNACSILEQRPSYARAFRATERKWGVPMHVTMAVMHQESRFVSNARTPMRYRLGIIPMGRVSSAYGYAQALDGTWDDYRREERAFGAKRNRIRHASDFMGWYMTKSLRRNGIPLSVARNQYLAYHEGHTGYARGSYNRKSWLLRVSNSVANRAAMYERQLQGCRAARR